MNIDVINSLLSNKSFFLKVKNYALQINIRKDNVILRKHKICIFHFKEKFNFFFLKKVIPINIKNKNYLKKQLLLIFMLNKTSFFFFFSPTKYELPLNQNSANNKRNERKQTINRTLIAWESSN